MKTIKTIAKVGRDRKASLLLEFPEEVKPGNYRMLIVLEEKAVSPAEMNQTDFDCQAWDWDAWPPDATYRREDIYDDNGR